MHTQYPKNIFPSCLRYKPFKLTLFLFVFELDRFPRCTDYWHQEQFIYSSDLIIGSMFTPTTKSSNFGLGYF
ncbi:hypothetical protein BpHYR1_050958 [Brachionus plicatilis]|uniref:Uncharacterized protein n=1 Tax=Brachionus plicatilis TaxID=10195 RepID=A0A3M7QX08_BRAPC|nr:hypothetical protein BpHYR1_050958 [Brachionus plicatilis]